MTLEMIDTPGLHPAGPEFRPNAAALRAVTGAFRHHRPDLVVYVDRCVWMTQLPRRLS